LNLLDCLFLSFFRQASSFPFEKSEAFSSSSSHLPAGFFHSETDPPFLLMPCRFLLSETDPAFTFLKLSAFFFSYFGLAAPHPLFSPSYFGLSRL
jgi:hypothetical protein